MQSCSSVNELVEIPIHFYSVVTFIIKLYSSRKKLFVFKRYNFFTCTLDRALKYTSLINKDLFNIFINNKIFLNF